MDDALQRYAARAEGQSATVEPRSQVEVSDRVPGTLAVSPQRAEDSSRLLRPRYAGVLIQPGTLLLALPLRSLFNPAQLTRGKSFAWTPRKTVDPRTSAAPLTTHQLLACWLAQWRAAPTPRPSSRWSAFFDSLPASFDTVPLTWAVGGDTHLVAALPAPLAERVSNMASRFHADWDRIRALDHSFQQEIWTCLAAGAPPAVQQADYLWGWLCVNSRCVYMDLHYARHDDNFTLAPLLDMANHTPVPGRECKVRFSGKDGLELLAPSDGLALGDEVCITYGPHSNATLLAEYGFVLPPDACGGADWPGNPHSEVNVDDAVAQLVHAQGEVGEWKQHILQEQGYWGYVDALTQRLHHAPGASASAPIAPAAHRAASVVPVRE